MKPSNEGRCDVWAEEELIVPAMCVVVVDPEFDLLAPEAARMCGGGALIASLAATVAPDGSTPSWPIGSGLLRSYAVVLLAPLLARGRPSDEVYVG